MMMTIMTIKTVILITATTTPWFGDNSSSSDNNSRSDRRHKSGISMLDHVQLDRVKLMIKMTNNEHPDKLFERMFAVKKQYAQRENGI